MDPNHRALERLKKDLMELQKTPMPNISASPLETNLFEWHCNIRQDQTVYHFILFFPQEYPFLPPTAELFPVGLRLNKNLAKPGQKGTLICLDIFPETPGMLGLQTGLLAGGWSPVYNVQSVLLYVLIFLEDVWRFYAPERELNKALCKTFTCQDCGHSHVSPSPALDVVDPTPFELVDYVSKKKLVPDALDDVWGYCLALQNTFNGPSLICPCELITAESFHDMKEAVGVVYSINRLEMNFFLPLFINAQHAERIQEVFEGTMKDIGDLIPGLGQDTPMEDLVLNNLSKVMTSITEQFVLESPNPDETKLRGFFAVHRLFLWALEKYPNLQEKIEDRLKSFIGPQVNRSMEMVPHIPDVLMLLSGSLKYRWPKISRDYLREYWNRTVLHCVACDWRLGFCETNYKYELNNLFDMTVMDRKHLALVVNLVYEARPLKMTREAVKNRYDENLGFPNQEMLTTIEMAMADYITQVKDFQDFYVALKLPRPYECEMCSMAWMAVEHCLQHGGEYLTGVTGTNGWLLAIEKNRQNEKEKEVKWRKSLTGSSTKSPTSVTGMGRKRPAPDDQVDPPNKRQA